MLSMSMLMMLMAMPDDADIVDTAADNNDDGCSLCVLQFLRYRGSVFTHTVKRLPSDVFTFQKIVFLRTAPCL